MKKRFKKIILFICVLVTVVTSFVVPSFAYTHKDPGDMTYWRDYSGYNSGGVPDLNYTSFFLDISMDTFAYSENEECGMYVSKLFDPSVAGNYATYNGCFSLRFANSIGNLTANYSYDIGYFEFSESGRVRIISSIDGIITAYVSDMVFLKEYYTKNACVPKLLEPFTDDIVSTLSAYEDKGFNPNTKCIFIDVDDTYYAKNRMSLRLGVFIYPNVATADDIYSAEVEHWLTKSETIQAEAYEIMLENEALTEQNAILSQNMENMEIENKYLRGQTEDQNAMFSLFNGIGAGFSNIIGKISGLGVRGITIGACLTVLVVIFVVYIIIKLILR